MKMSRKGSLANRAKRAGKSKAAFAQANIHADSPVGKMARMAYIAQGVHGSGKSNGSEPGDKRAKGNPLYQLG